MVVSETQTRSETMHPTYELQDTDFALPAATCLKDPGRLEGCVIEAVVCHAMLTRELLEAFAVMRGMLTVGLDTLDRRCNGPCSYACCARYGEQALPCT